MDLCFLIPDKQSAVFESHQINIRINGHLRLIRFKHAEIVPGDGVLTRGQRTPVVEKFFFFFFYTTSSLIYNPVENFMFEFGEGSSSPGHSSPSATTPHCSEAPGIWTHAPEQENNSELTIPYR